MNRQSRYGRGPLETYPDCKEGNAIGCWEKNVEDFYFPYVLPQETGNHEDTRWAAFVTEAGNGILYRIGQRILFWRITLYTGRPDTGDTYK